MVARLKATQRNKMPNISNAKYPTGIVIDPKNNGTCVNTPHTRLFYHKLNTKQ